MQTGNPNGGWNAPMQGGPVSGGPAQSGPFMGKLNGMAHNGNGNQLMQLLQKMGVDPSIMQQLQTPNDPNRPQDMMRGGFGWGPRMNNHMGMGQGNRGNLSPYANRMGNMGGGFGRSPISMRSGQIPSYPGKQPWNPDQYKDYKPNWGNDPPPTDWNDPKFGDWMGRHSSEGPGGMTGHNQDPNWKGGFQRGPLPSMMPSQQPGTLLPPGPYQRPQAPSNWEEINRMNGQNNIIGRWQPDGSYAS
jgi:hypothetical protein